TDGVDGGDSIAHQAQSSLDKSTIHKFALDGVSTSYRGSAAIPGHVLNQFSMDELDGVLRVATSSGWVPDPSVSSNLTTLSERDGGLSQLGSIGGIAPTEDIRSVRFDGTRAFVVTFKKTDPLFVFDLTNPAAPAKLGELKIPGFSTYMHPLDHDHLLAIGFDADDHGDFAFFDGIQLQIFDVSNLANPTLLHKTTIGTRGSASEALTNHLAFNYFPAKGVLALPMSICEGGDDGVYGDKLTFSGLMVFDVSLENGIKEHGRMPFVDSEQVTSSLGPNATCGNWWASSTSDVKRSIFMDDYAIGISDTKYQVAPLSALSSVVQTLPLGTN
ncbi:MAG TPA: beta-propeller domain-containing protein, partial [Polyangiaceae bacterium]|nr:beta-propeller domain-containing protein [Polyangiaceae bacterium]